MTVAVLGPPTRPARAPSPAWRAGVGTWWRCRGRAGSTCAAAPGLLEALERVDVVIDASYPVDERLAEAVATATRQVLDGCARQRVRRLVLLSIAGIEDPMFDGSTTTWPSTSRNRTVSQGPVPASIIKSTQLYEFATHPAAVTFGGDEVAVRDWLIQPVAAATVAEVLVATEPGAPRSCAIAGPQPVRLPG